MARRPHGDSLTLDWEGLVPRSGQGGQHPLRDLVDLAHAAPRAQHQVLDASAAPVLWSHSNAMALCPHRISDHAALKALLAWVLPTTMS